MSLKDILVHADSSSASERRLRAAVSLARRHDAHLTALFVIDNVFPYSAVDPTSDYLGVGGMEACIEQATAGARATADQVQAKFEHLLARAGVRGEWRCVEGSTAPTILLHASYADLCVLGQENPAGSTRPPDGFPLDRVLFGSGRPILIMPAEGDFEEVGTNVVVGWTPERQAVRAINDALPLLRAARRTTVVMVNPEEAETEEVAEDAAVATHLARHGVEVGCRGVNSEIGHEGAALLRFAKQLSADLLVVGAYGHSRLHEFILGGATRTILREMSLPVLMSH